MIPDIRLLFYGDSIFLAGLKADLETAVAHSHPFPSLPPQTSGPDALQFIRAYLPQIIFFDLTNPCQPNFAIPLLREQPSLLFIGLDPSRSDLLVLSSQAPQVDSYQGQVAVDGTAYKGAGYFKFAVVNAAGDTTYWANDGTAASEPATAVHVLFTPGHASGHVSFYLTDHGFVFDGDVLFQVAPTYPAATMTCCSVPSASSC